MLLGFLMTNLDEAIWTIRTWFLESQKREDTQTLAQRIYQHFHVGNTNTVRFNGKEDTHDEQLVRQIIEATPGDEIWRKVQIIEENSSGVIVSFEDIRVLVPKSRFKQGESTNEVQLPKLRPFVSPGYTGTNERNFSPIWRIYIYINSSEDVVPTWNSAVGQAQLHFGELFHAKVASSPKLFPRNDGIVFYVSTHNESQIVDYAQCIELSELCGSSSLLAKTIRPGISLGQEPFQSQNPKKLLSFGQHRAEVLSEILQDAGTSDQHIFEKIAVDILRIRGINPAAIYQNESIHYGSIGSHVDE